MKNRKAKILQTDVFRAIDDLSNQKKTFDLIYLDPPYTVDEIFEPVMDSMGKANLLDPDGMLVIRPERKRDEGSIWKSGKVQRKSVWDF